jgi:DNA recombination protein RmuC
MESIGRSLETTRKTFDQATNKLYSGSGNLVARAEKIRKLGAKTSKDLPIERLSDED